MIKQQGMKWNIKAQNETIGQGQIAKHEIKAVRCNEATWHKARRIDIGSKWSMMAMTKESTNNKERKKKGIKKL